MHHKGKVNLFKKQNKLETDSWSINKIIHYINSQGEGSVNLLAECRQQIEQLISSKITL